MVKADKPKKSWLRNKQVFGAMLAGFVLVLYIFFLLYENYHVEKERHRYFLEVEYQKTEHNATILSYFFSEVREDMNAVKRSTSFANFNATGPGVTGSGTDSPLRKIFQRVIAEKTIGDDPVYEGIALVDSDGKILLEVSYRNSSKIEPFHVRGLLEQIERQKMGVFPHREGVIVVVPAEQKGTIRSYLLARVRPETLFHSVIGEKGVRGDDYGARVLVDEKNAYFSGGNHFHRYFQRYDEYDSIRAGHEPNFLRLRNEGGGSDRLIALKAPINDAGLYLIHIFPEKTVYGRLTGLWYMAAMMILALAVIGGVVSIIMATMRSMILRTRLEESSLHWQDIEDKKRLLEIEVALRKEMEKKARENEAFISTVVQQIPVALFVKHADTGEFVLWNQASEHIFGIPADQIIGKTDYDFFPREQADFFREKDAITLQKGMPEDIPEEIVDSHALGRRVLHTTKIPIYDQAGIPKYLLGISEDITDLKETERAFRESEERYRTAIEHSNDGIAITKLDTFVYVNRKFLEMFGFSSMDELSRKQLSATVHPDDAGRVIGHAASRQKGEPAPNRYEFRGLRKDGTIIEIEVSVTSIIIRGEQYNLAYLRDVTERKRAEEIERRRSRDLADMVKELQLFNQLTVDRELRMIELKKQINELRKSLGETPLFNIEELECELSRNANVTIRSETL